MSAEGNPGSDSVETQALEGLGLMPVDGLATCPSCDRPSLRYSRDAVTCDAGCSRAAIVSRLASLGRIAIPTSVRVETAAWVKHLRAVARGGGCARVTCLADIQPKAVEWLWLERLPAGMVSVLDGPPGAGKSTLVIDIVARLTTGRPLPGETGSRPPATVVLLGHEDSPEHTIRPRLDAAKADASRVRLLMDIGGRPPRLPDDGAEIERVVRETGASLLVVDPISAYLGQADLHRDNDVRVALAPLAAIAANTGAAVLLLRHLRKSGGVDAMGRGIGSVGIIALARTGIMLLPDPNDPEARILAWSKMSLGPLPPSLRWRFRVGADGPNIAWEGVSNLSANEILSRQDRALRGGGDTAATAVDGAEDWLMGLFEESDTIPVVEIQRRAAIEGISWRTIERAKGRLGIRSRRESLPVGRGSGQWVWVASSRRMPDNDGSDPDGIKAATQAPLADLKERESKMPSGSTPGEDLGGETKAATFKTAKPEVAALFDAETARPYPDPEDLDEDSLTLDLGEVAS